jgi:dTDP-glucose pyrophosphorylase
MGGRGSRFQRGGQFIPKPLIELRGHPMFHWAVESLVAAVHVRDMIFVVLAEHVDRYRIDRRIRAYYPKAQVVCIPEVTAGAAETAAIGAGALARPGPFAINDCDLAFDTGPGFGEVVRRLHADAAGALLGFAASSTAYSYVMLDSVGRVTGTAEKQVVGKFAIAGCYLFDDPANFQRQFDLYRQTCPYQELFLSGMYNLLCRQGLPVIFHQLASHVSFGTPEELERVQDADMEFLMARTHRIGP